MLFPTLFQLAVKSVAQQIHNEQIPLDFNLASKATNAVVRQLLKLDPKNIEKLKTHKNQLSRLKELDLSECEIDVEGVLNLKNFKLTSLDIGDFYDLRMEFLYTTDHEIDIVSLLERSVDTDSREMMVHFGFSGGYQEFERGWEEKISKLFPSLQSLKLKLMEFNKRFRFSNLCNSFPNLRTLDISFAVDLSTLKGIKNLKNLQKFVMRGVDLDAINGYKELAKLKNLRVLDVSGEEDHDTNVVVILSLLISDARIENLEFLDCSMTSVDVDALKEFVKRHPKLKTVVTISTKCNNSYIPNVDLLNYNSSDSTIKSLEYAIANDREDLTGDCIRFIAEKLNTNHNQLNDSKIRGLLNALRYVLRESKNEIRYLALQCFGKSSFFETERFFELFWLEVPGMVELIFKSWDHFKFSEFQTETTRSLILAFIERMVNFLKLGKILQDRLLNFIIEKTIELSCRSPENHRKITSILIEINRFMSSEQQTTMCNNKTVIKELFDFSHRLITLDPSSYQQIMELIVRCLNQASEDTLNYLVSNCQAVEKCYEHSKIISYWPRTDSLSKIVLKLMSVINLNDPDEETKAVMACLTLSLLLAKNLIDDREYVNTKLEEFNDCWGRSNILDYKNVPDVLTIILSSEYSTDASIRFGLMLTSTFVNAKICESTEYWNWIKTTLEFIRNNEMCTKKTRDSASSVLNEMSTIEKKWIFY